MPKTLENFRDQLTAYIADPMNGSMEGYTRVSKFRGTEYSELHPTKLYTTFGSGIIRVDQASKKVFFIKMNGMPVLYTSLDKDRKVKKCQISEYDIVDGKLDLIRIGPVAIKRIKVIKKVVKDEVVKTESDKKESIVVKVEKTIHELIQDKLYIQLDTIKIHREYKELFPDHVSDVPVMFPKDVRGICQNNVRKVTHALLEMEQTFYTNTLLSLGRSTSTCIAILLKSCSVIRTMHARDRLHLDWKPENILLNYNLEPLINDIELSEELYCRIFNIAKYAFYPDVGIMTTFIDVYSGFISACILVFRNRMSDLLYQENYTCSMLYKGFPAILISCFFIPDIEITLNKKFNNTRPTDWLTCSNFLKIKSNQFAKDPSSIGLNEQIAIKFFDFYQILLADEGNINSALERNITVNKETKKLKDYLAYCDKESYLAEVKKLQGKHQSIDDLIAFLRQILDLINLLKPEFAKTNIILPEPYATASAAAAPQQSS